MRAVVIGPGRIGCGFAGHLLAQSGYDVTFLGRELRGHLPAIQGMRVVSDYRAYVQKKLFTFSAGHATTAYLGALKGYRYVHAAIRDLEIRARVLAAMDEGRSGLEAQYGAEIAGTYKDLHAIVSR